MKTTKRKNHHAKHRNYRIIQLNIVKTGINRTERIKNIQREKKAEKTGKENETIQSIWICSVIFDQD